MRRLGRTWNSLLACTTALLLIQPASGAEVNRFLPEDTEVVAFVNVRQLLDAPLVKKHALEQVKALLKDNAELRNSLNAVGLDPLRDVSSVTLAGPGKDLQTKAVFIVNGTFQVDKIHTLADKIIENDPNSLKVQNIGKLRIYETKGKDGLSAFAAFMDRNTAVISPSQDSLLAAAKSSQLKAPPIKRELVTLIQQADARYSVWFAALATSEVKELLKSNAQTAGVADRVTSFTGAVNLSNAMQAAIQIHVTDLRSAGEVHRLMEALKGFVQFAAMSNKEYGPLFGEILEAMKVSSQRNVVTVGGKISGDVIEKGLKKARKP